MLVEAGIGAEFGSRLKPNNSSLMASIQLQKHRKLGMLNNGGDNTIGQNLKPTDGEKPVKKRRARRRQNQQQQEQEGQQQLLEGQK